MSEEEQPREQSAEEVDKELDERYQQLLDTNQKIINLSREKAKAMAELRDFYLEQAEQCDTIAEMHVRGAQLCSSTIGDILSVEWGFEEDDPVDDEEDESE